MRVHYFHSFSLSVLFPLKDMQDEGEEDEGEEEEEEEEEAGDKE